MTPERAARRLRDLLASERAAAAAGDLDRLARLAPEKERLSIRVEEALACGALGRPEAEGLAAALDEAAPLLRATLEGMRSARRRLEAAEEARRAPFRTYGRDGTAGPMARPAGPTRRA